MEPVPDLIHILKRGSVENRTRDLMLHFHLRDLIILTILGERYKLDIQIKLLIENKLIICLGNLHYKVSREKFEPEPGFEPRISGFIIRRSTT